MEREFPDVKLATQTPVQIDDATYVFSKSKLLCTETRVSATELPRKVICIRGIPFYVSNSFAPNI
jgi:hypothetical protein